LHRWRENFQPKTGRGSKSFWTENWGAFQMFPDSRQIQESVQRDWLAERKRLREARTRWIEENECPVQFGNTLIDSEGRAWPSPFQIGAVRYGGDDGRGAYPSSEPLAMVPPVTPEAAKQLLEGAGRILRESAETTGVSTCVLNSEGEQSIFLVGESDRSPHPAIHEGEDYGEYCQRVGRAYEAAAGAGRTNSRADGVWLTSAADPAGLARAAVSGAGAGRPDGAPNLDCEPGGMLAEEPRFVYWNTPREFFPSGDHLSGRAYRSSFAARCMRAVRRLWKAGQRARLRYLRR
jgi:hypothetical protein